VFPVSTVLGGLFQQPASGQFRGDVHFAYCYGLIDQWLRLNGNSSILTLRTARNLRVRLRQRPRPELLVIPQAKPEFHSACEQAHGSKRRETLKNRWPALFPAASDACARWWRLREWPEPVFWAYSLPSHRGILPKLGFDIESGQSNEFEQQDNMSPRTAPPLPGTGACRVTCANWSPSKRRAQRARRVGAPRGRAAPAAATARDVSLADSRCVSENLNLQACVVAGVRRLFGHADRDRRSDDGRDPRGEDLRRRARRLEPHLCRGDLDADVHGLDRRPMCACFAFSAARRSC
jgi:hypothetical protein